METVRVLVGTKKGAFILLSDPSRTSWTITGPHFPGWEVYHIKGSPIDPNRIFASQSTGWFGQYIQRSDDGGQSWKNLDAEFRYDGTPGDHLWFDGTPRPFSFSRVWSVIPAPNDLDTVYAGVEDAALFKSVDAGHTWSEISSLRTTGNSQYWAPGAGGMAAHTILIDQEDPNTIFVAISAAGVFGTNDGGTTWNVLTNGLSSPFLPNPESEIGHCVHRIAQGAGDQNRLYMQKHWVVMRSDNAGKNWYEISGDLPSDFGFVIGAHPRETDTLFVIPITSDSEHFPPDGRLAVYRSKVGGMEWESLTNGLPQANCYVDVLRGALAIDSLDPCGIYFGTTGGQVYRSSDEGDSWEAVARDLPPVLSVEVQVY